MAVPPSRWVLNQTLPGTLCPQLAECWASCCQCALGALALKPPLGPHCLQDRVHAPPWSHTSQSLSLSCPSWVWAELNILTPCRQAWPFLPGFGAALFWGCTDGDCHGRGRSWSIPWGPPTRCRLLLPPVSPSPSLLTPSAWVTLLVTVDPSRLRWALCPLLGGSSLSPQ